MIIPLGGSGSKTGREQDWLLFAYSYEETVQSLLFMETTSSLAFVIEKITRLVRDSIQFISANNNLEKKRNGRDE